MKVSLTVCVPDHHLKIGERGVVKKWFGQVAIVQFTTTCLVMHKHQIKEIK